MIEKRQDHERQLTVFTCSGPVTLEDFKAALAEFYRQEPTRDLLWDLTGADLSTADIEQAEELAKFVKGIAHSREGGKNALITSLAFAYSLGKMYQLFADIAKQTSRTRVFQSRAEAEAWLQEIEAE